MREHPWHIRRPTNHHYQWYGNLLDLHRMTVGWLDDLNRDRADQLKRAASPGIHETLEILDNITATSVPPRLETLLDDSLPEELLARLDQTVWVVQTWTLLSILDRTPPRRTCRGKKCA